MFGLCAVIIFLVFGEIAADTSENCVTYNFEEEYENIFTANKTQCQDYDHVWNLGKFDLSTVIPPHEASSSFIYPTPGFDSCVSSFVFNISQSNSVEVNAYLESVSPEDRLILIVLAQAPSGPDYPIGTGVLLPNTEGWQTVIIDIDNPVTVSTNGYVRIIIIYLF